MEVNVLHKTRYLVIKVIFGKNQLNSASKILVPSLMTNMLFFINTGILNYLHSHHKHRTTHGLCTKMHRKTNSQPNE